MALKVQNVAVAAGALFGEAKVTWSTSGLGAEETITGFEVLVDGKLKAEVGPKATSVTLSGVGGSHAFKVVAVVTHDSSAETTTEVDDGLPPRKLGAPAIEGTVKKGNTLTANPGAWKGKGVTFAYQWLRCQGDADSPSSAIAIATASTYPLVAADVGNRIRVRVTATTEGGGEASEVAKATVKVAN